MFKPLKNLDTTLLPHQEESKMLKEDHHKVVKELYAKGTAKREIARRLEIDIKTVRRHLKKAQWHAYQRSSPAKSSSLLEDQTWLIKRMPEVNYTASILYREIQHQGYEGGITQLREFLLTLKEKSEPESLVRFETKLGQ